MAWFDYELTGSQPGRKPGRRIVKRTFFRVPIRKRCKRRPANLRELQALRVSTSWLDCCRELLDRT